jgi:hypothetical protein
MLLSDFHITLTPRIYILRLEEYFFFFHLRPYSVVLLPVVADEQEFQHGQISHEQSDGF